MTLLKIPNWCGICFMA